MAGNGQGQPDPDANENTNGVPSEGSDTQEPTNQTPPTDGSGHGDNQGKPSNDPSEGGGSDDNPQGGDDRDEIAKRREEGKLQQVQQELKELQQYKTYYDNIVSAAKSSPEKYKKALIEFNGATEQEADAVVRQMIAEGEFQPQQGQGQYNQQAGQYPQGNNQNPYGQYGQNPQNPYGVQQQPNQDPAQVAERVFAEKYQQMQQQQRVQKDFWERVPEMDPSNVPDEQKKHKAILASAVEYAATQMVQQNKDMDIVDALVESYKNITGRTDEQLESAREEGRMQGYLEANASKAGSSSSAKGYSPREGSHGLSRQQMKQADDAGISYERYSQLVNNPETTVE